MRQAKSSQPLVQRCRIVSCCATGKSNKMVAAELGGPQQMVCKLRQRFMTDRLDGLAEEPRPRAVALSTDRTDTQITRFKGQPVPSNTLRHPDLSKMSRTASTMS